MTEQEKQAIRKLANKYWAEQIYTGADMDELLDALDERDREVERLDDSRKYWWKEARRMQKALQKIHELETLCDQPSLFNSLLTINEIARKALAGEET